MICIELIGNLVRTPETRTIQKGDSDGRVCNFTVAASYGYGEYKRTEYVRVAAWNGLGKTCQDYLAKGSKVWLSGIPTVNTYVNSEGNAVGNLEIRLDEIEFLSSKPTESTENVEQSDEDIEKLL